MAKRKMPRQEQMQLDVDATEELSIEASYDQYPVHTLPNSLTHPDHLAVIAKLFSMNPKPLHDCRILEIGCGDGGNLIPIAMQLPKSQCFGVDISGVQIDRGNALIKKLQLKNIKLEKNILLKVGGKIRKFDYIICHDVFSNVGEEEQKRILQFGKDYLSNQGVMCISYDVSPGADPAQSMRDMVRFHAQRFKDIEERIQQSRALMSFVVREDQDVADPKKMLAGQAVNMGDADIVHRFLDPHRSVFSFIEFTQHAEENGLQFLAEADFSTMLLNQLPSDLADTLMRISDDVMQLEQYLDYVRNRNFRITLLCHDSIKIDRAIDSEKIKQLKVAANLQLVSKLDDSTVRFRSLNGVDIASHNVVTTAAFDQLQKHWPKSCDYEELEKLSQASDNPNSLDMDLLQAYGINAIRLSTIDLPIANAVSAKPLASALSRLQAATNSYVTNMMHQLVALDEPIRQLLMLCNGRRTLDDLTKAMVAMADEGVLQLRFEDQVITDQAKLFQYLQQALPAMLNQLKQLALLVR